MVCGFEKDALVELRDAFEKRRIDEHYIEVGLRVQGLGFRVQGLGFWFRRVFRVFRV